MSFSGMLRKIRHSLLPSPARGCNGCECLIIVKILQLGGAYEAYACLTFSTHNLGLAAHGYAMYTDGHLESGA